MTDEPPVFQRLGLGYAYVPKGKGVTFRVNHMKWTGGELFGVVEITADNTKLTPHLTRQRVNMTGGNGRITLAKHLSGRCEGEIGFEYSDWIAMLESFFIRVGDAESVGNALEWVGDEEPPDGVPHVVERVVERDGINVLFGPGDQGKSWVALYLRICVQLGIKCLGLDVVQMETLAVEYEAPAETYTRRMRAVLAGLGLPYQKMRLWRPTEVLPRQVDALARIIDAEKVGFYTVDSAGHAAGSPGEHGTWEDAALALGKSLKVHLPATPLVIDHTTAEGSREKLSGRPSGAYRKYADARVLWECRKAQEQENAWSLLGLYHTKGNNSIRWRPIGIRMEFESDVWGRAKVVRFSRDDDALKGDSEHAGRQSLKVRILESLEGQMTNIQLAKLVDADVDSVGAKLRELRREGLTRTVEQYKGGQGNVLRWEKCLPEYPNALNKDTVRSGNAGLATHPAYPNTRIEDYPNVRVNDGSPPDPPSGATAGRNGTGHEPEGAQVWGGDAEDVDDDIPF